MPVEVQGKLPETLEEIGFVFAVETEDAGEHVPFENLIDEALFELQSLVSPVVVVGHDIFKIEFRFFLFMGIVVLVVFFMDLVKHEFQEFLAVMLVVVVEESGGLLDHRVSFGSSGCIS